MTKHKGTSSKISAKKDTRKSNFGDTRIRRHKINEWISYEVKQEELDLLEKGSQSDKFLEFGIAAATACISFFIAWLSVDYKEQEKLYVIYMIIFIIFLITSLILLLLWHSSKGNLKSVYEEIKNRPLDEEYSQ